MPRLFTALEVPGDIAFQLSLMRGGLNGARWIEQENYHITLRFIGDIDGPTADEVVYRLGKVTRNALKLRIKGLDVFGGNRPRALFARIEMTNELQELQAEQERIMQRLGLRPEGRKFTPHVTLARLKGTKSHEAAHYLSTRGGFHTPDFQVGRFVLYSSRGSMGGGPYLVEEAYDLAA